MKIPGLILVAVCVSVPLYAKTQITTTNPNITTSGLDETIEQFDSILGRNGKPAANAFALANMGGYAIGNAAIGSFPHMFVGVSFTGGLANTSALDNNKTVPQGTVPVAGVNPVVYLGLGLSKRTDIMFKLMLFSSGFVDVPLTYEGMELEKINVYSVGGKFRYNLVEEIPVLPGIVSFKGVTLSLGGDLMYGIINASGSYLYPMEQIEVNVPPPTPINVDFDINYDLEISWYLITINPQALVYFNFFWIFNIYTGFGLPVNFGSVSVNLDANGTVTTDNSAYILANGNGDIGVLGIESKNNFIPYYVMPVYIFGIDLEILSFHLAFETMVNLYNAKDVSVQLATRMQF